ncbi:hypothetical protein GCM10009579_36470 [Streptomyces javensis]|uniref:Uncharacterized protein n=1 Tax=Streptomyces javensis TaxID=114698 RepID=A0ABP4HMJ9_9ACTN
MTQAFGEGTYAFASLRRRQPQRRQHRECRLPERRHARLLLQPVRRLLPRPLFRSLAEQTFVRADSQTFGGLYEVTEDVTAGAWQISPPLYVAVAAAPLLSGAVLALTAANRRWLAHLHH